MSNILPALSDAHGRNAHYLRLSVTDRCNLSCSYCVSCGRQRYIPHERILRYEEFHRFIWIARRLGVGKIRITGGEPFVRKGLMGFLSSLRRRHPSLQITITTNGTLLGPFIDDLAPLGLGSFNISLDSFKRDTFKEITGSDCLDTVLANIDRLLVLGQRIKINAVALAGVTDQQMADFVYAARIMPVDIRFIEFMPMGGNTSWDEASFITCARLRQLAQSHTLLSEDAMESDGLAGPAKMYAISGGKGRIGFISAISEHFCNTCNRLRITSEGKLRTCLFADQEFDLARLLRNSKISDANIAKALNSALARKPVGADILAAKSRIAVAGAQMVGIGG